MQNTTQSQATERQVHHKLTMPKSNKRNAPKVRVNQRWRRNDSGKVMTIVSKQGDSWRVVFDTRHMKSSHKILERAIKQFYTCISE